MAQLRGALQIARAGAFRLDEARARDWLPAELAAPAAGVTRVLYHSSVWLYLPPEEREAIEQTLASAGAAATPESPVAWLRHEDDDDHPGRMALLLRTWPGERVEYLARGHPHGRRVAWGGAEEGA